MTSTTGFRFPADTIAFLADLARHNDKAWFDAHRARYQAAYVEPARALVESVAPDLREIVPGIRAEPRVLGSIFRINRDTRFSPDKRPYKDHLDFWFWEGERKTAVSGLFLRVSPDGVVVGAGAHGFDRDRLALYRGAVGDPNAGRELAAVVERIEAHGHEVGGETLSRTPRGQLADAAAERFLRHRALFAHAELPAGVATRPDLLSTLLRHWTTFAPVHRWLTDHLGPA